jgi:guanylate kinase
MGEVSATRDPQTVPCRRGPLIIISGPSGTGKSTLIGRLLRETDLPLHLSVSATTRAPRPNEVDGQHYYFGTREKFEQEMRAGAFLEWAEVHGQYYGTLRREVEPYRARGVGVLLDIDVQGAAQVRRQCPDNVSIFLRASSWQTYEERLRKRGTESEEAIRRRLETARRELACEDAYDCRIVNDDLDVAVVEVSAVIRRQFEGGNDAR